MLVKRPSKRWAALAATAVTLGLAAATLTTATPANAAPGCKPAGVYVIWARGSGAGFNANEATTFKQSLEGALAARGITSPRWVELGNFDENGRFDPPNEWPAVPGNNVNPTYGASVEIGTRELIAHLNQRYSSSGQNCVGETVVLGGYSQGADVIGWALEWQGPGGLTQTARSHIGYTALYGDPRFNINCQQDNWWSKAFTTCDSNPLLGERVPYAREEFRGRFGSWCDSGDGFCGASVFNEGLGNHLTIYNNYWISNSAGLIADAARSRVLLLNPPPPSFPPNANLFYVKNHASGSGRVEIHSAEAAGYGSGQHNATRFGLSDQNNGWFEIEGPRDLYFIKTKNTTSGKVEIHIATNASGYQSGTGFVTRFSTAEADKGWFQMIGDALWYIKTKDTGSQKVEVHLATRASGYQSGASMSTWMTTADQSNGYFQMVGNDLFFIKTRNTPNSKVEIHSATQATNWQAGQHNATYISTTNQNNGWFQMLGPDLYFVQTKNTTTQKVEIHSALAAHGYQAGAHAATYISTVEQDKGWFQIDLK